MSAKPGIRISAILILIHLLGHTGGHIGWDDPTVPLGDVVKTMKSHSAEFMGATKSMADYFQGYSLIMFGLFGMTIALLWILSVAVESNTKLVKQLLFPIGITYLLFGAIEYMYFFPFAAIISFLAGVFALYARTKLKLE